MMLVSIVSSGLKQLGLFRFVYIVTAHLTRFFDSDFQTLL